MRALFILLFMSSFLWGQGYPNEPTTIWLTDSYHDLFKDKVTQYEREQALKEFVKRYEWFISKLNYQKSQGNLRPTLHMAQYETAREYLVESFFQVGLREENWEHWNVTRAMVKNTYLEIRLLSHIYANLSWFNMPQEERNLKAVEILEEIINHPEFLQYNDLDEIGSHINLLGVLATEYEKIDSNTALTYYDQYFKTGIEFNRFPTKSFFKKWQHFKNLSLQNAYTIDNLTKIDKAVNTYYAEWGKKRTRTDWDQHLIDEQYFAHTDTIINNNLKEMMIVKPDEGEGPCLSHKRIGQTVRKGGPAPDLKFFFEDCMGNPLVKDTPYEISLDYGTTSDSPWFTVSTSSDRFTFKEPVIVTVSFQSTHLEIGEHEGKITITTPKGTTTARVQLGIWY